MRILKNIPYKILVLAFMSLLLFVMTGYEANCQNVVTGGYSHQSIDSDFRQMRYNLAPGFNHSYDDYLQYVPGVALLGMKAGCVPGMTKFGRFAVSTAFSVGLMAGVVNGLKYTVNRERPDFSGYNSFPSGHAATAFMTATLLHKEYGWKYPWISCLGYTTATITGLSRVMNNRHWISDIVTGAAIGIGSVHLGYYLAGLIFKDRQIRDEWYKEPFEYDKKERGYWSASLNCGRRFILGKRGDKDASNLPYRGSSAFVGFELPIMSKTGVIVDVGANSLIFKNDTSINTYNALAGLYWSLPFAKIMEFQAKAALGYAWHSLGSGIDVLASLSLNVFTGHNFRLKAFAEYETFSFSEHKPFLNSFVVGWSTGICW